MILGHSTHPTGHPTSQIPPVETSLYYALDKSLILEQEDQPVSEIVIETLDTVTHPSDSGVTELAELHSKAYLLLQEKNNANFKFLWSNIATRLVPMEIGQVEKNMSP